MRDDRGWPGRNPPTVVDEYRDRFFRKVGLGGTYRDVSPFRDVYGVLGRVGGTLTGAQLINVNDKQTNSTKKSDPLPKCFPPRSLIWSACSLSFGISWWGWHNLRNDRRIMMSNIVCFFGSILWVYGFSKLIAL